MLGWLLVITTSFLFFMVGTQLIKFNADDWYRVSQFQSLEHFVGRSVLGGVIFGFMGILLAKYFFRFKYNVMDSFAWAAPLGLVVQRFGCFMAGCCYGNQTSLPWGIQYGEGSHAFVHHINEELIPLSAHSSLMIHPVALYEIMGCLLAMVCLYRIRKYINASGNLFLVSLSLYGVVRFVTEFFRANAPDANYYFGLTMVQLVILAIVPILVWLIQKREGKAENIITSYTPTLSKMKILLGFFTIVSLFLLVSRWLSPLEIFTLNLVMIPTLCYASWKIFSRVTVPSMRLTTVLFLVGSLIMMSQTLPESAPSDSVKRHYNIFSIGTMAGKTDIDLTVISPGCDGSSSYEYNLKHQFNSNGAGYTRVEEQGNGKVLQYGINLYQGNIKETVTDDMTNKYYHRSRIIGINPYAQYDWSLLGAGLGFHTGSSMVFVEPEYKTTSEPTLLKEITFFPSAYFRIGYVNRFFGEVKLGQQFPSPFPLQTLQTNFGIGFRKFNGGAIRIGTASYAGLVIAPTLPLGKNLLIDLNMAVLPGLVGPIFENGFETREVKSIYSGSFTVRLKLGYKSH